MAVTYKAKSGVNQVVFRPRTWKNPQIFLARAFGTRDVFTVILLGTRAKSDHSRASAFGAFSVFECFCEEVTYKAKSGGNLVFFAITYKKKPSIFLSRAFGARDVFTVIFLGRRAKNDHRRASAFGACLVFECFGE